MKITKIQQQKQKKNRYNIFIDNKYSFSVDTNTLIDEGIKLGNITQKRLDELKKTAIVNILYSYALQHESRRPHSRFEHKLYLLKKIKTLKLETQKNDSYISAAIDKLISKGYQNDENFTEWYIKQKTTGHKPKGKLAIMNDLIKKGVSKDIIHDKLNSNITTKIEIKNAQKIADKKISLLKNGGKQIDDEKMKEKVIKYLLSRGYGYNVIKCLKLI